jgi:hypothetical protein
VEQLGDGVDVAPTPVLLEVLAGDLGSAGRSGDGLIWHRADASAATSYLETHRFKESALPFEPVEAYKPLCVFRGASFGAGDAMSQVHEFMLLGFAEGIGAGEQLLVMEALDHHLSRCEGLLGREYFRGEDGRWVENVTWASQADLDASARLEDDPVVAELFGCFDERSVSYLRGERIEPDGPGPRRGEEVAPL